MDEKDSFRTHAYKGGYINTCWNRTTRQAEVFAVLPNHKGVRPASSIRAAKILITRHATTPNH